MWRSPLNILVTDHPRFFVGVSKTMVALIGECASAVRANGMIVKFMCVWF